MTCISLLLTDGFERSVLQSLELELQELEVHYGLPAVILELRSLGPLDSKHRRPASVRSSDFDRPELASSHEHVGTQEEVIRLDQSPSPMDGKEEID
ncbi:MAG: hypothetical protein ACRD1Z_20140 [Vicinamibacteria bacterium]